ncbi:T9SS type A sorting domain-containing protein [Taibaiella koreensis]|uniref:T9SS type A sorting domain-containing protein n=1 Tax=Taibaiella koreensis TaxID=1268548 RepID=UPI0013C35D30|nr:T9SS type A sorting domain-containing protein [Taibaiella koreensis]
MKLLYTATRKGFVATVLAVALGMSAQAQITIFSENMGGVPVSNNTPVIAYNGFQNSGGSIVYSGSADVRITTPSSTSRYASASAGNNVFLTTAAGTNFSISNIPITGATNIAVSFGIAKSTNAENGSGVSVQAIVDGGAPVDLPVVLSTGTGTSNWVLTTPTATIPTGNSLTLTFTKAGGSATFRIDDILITSSTPLPVSLTDFTAARKENSVQLSWATATEKNASHFEIERSQDGSQFAAVGKVAARNIATGASYSYTDNTAGAATVYYRLKNVDRDGSAEYSKVVVVEGKGVKGNVALTANLVRNVLPVTFKGEQGAYQLQVVNLAGTVLQHQSVNGVASVQLDIASLAPGFYLLQVAGANGKETFKFVKQ